MFAVIFVVEPKPDRLNDYLDLAKHLKPKLEGIDGFIDVERFESKRAKGRLLSLSTWRDEKAVVRWRTQGEHHGVQERGRFEIFADYRLLVGEITDDSDPPKGLRVEEKRLDETEVGHAKAATVTELVPRDAGAFGARPEGVPAQLGLSADRDGLVDVEVFESIYNPGKLVVLALWHDAAAAKHWAPGRPQAAQSLRQRRVRIVRDYGMRDRREAPQYYPDVAAPGRMAAE